MEPLCSLLFVLRSKYPLKINKMLNSFLGFFFVKSYRPGRLSSQCPLLLCYWEIRNRNCTFGGLLSPRAHQETLFCWSQHCAFSHFASVHQAMMPNPASSYQTVVGVQPTPNLALTGNQQSNMGNQMQGMMVQYPPMQSYQVLWWGDASLSFSQWASARVMLALLKTSVVLKSAFISLFMLTH